MVEQSALDERRLRGYFSDHIHDLMQHTHPPDVSPPPTLRQWVLVQLVIQ